jgi:hypothetical protein
MAPRSALFGHMGIEPGPHARDPAVLEPLG